MDGISWAGNVLETHNFVGFSYARLVTEAGVPAKFFYDCLFVSVLESHFLLCPCLLWLDFTFS